VVKAFDFPYEHPAAGAAGEQQTSAVFQNDRKPAAALDCVFTAVALN
jgi:hypothetical protein